jgi:hypothetical protein
MLLARGSRFRPRKIFLSTLVREGKKQFNFRAGLLVPGSSYRPPLPILTGQW